MYLQNDLRSQHENVKTNDLQLECRKQDGSVNHNIQVTENHELSQYLKHDNEWLQDRIEHFEKTQDSIFKRIDTMPKEKKHELLWYRM